MALVNVAAMPDSDHEDEEDVVVHLVDDPIVAGAHSPFHPRRRPTSWRRSVLAGLPRAQWPPGSVAEPRGPTSGAVGPRLGRPRCGESCQAEIGLDLIPGDHQLASIQLRTGRRGRLDIGEVLTAPQTTEQMVRADG